MSIAGYIIVSTVALAIIGMFACVGLTELRIALCNEVYMPYFGPTYTREGDY